MQPAHSVIEPLPLRLAPGDDLRGRLEALVHEQAWPAAFVLAGTGSAELVIQRL